MAEDSQQPLALSRVGIVAKPSEAAIPPLIEKATAWLEQRGIAVVYDEFAAQHIGRGDGFDRENPPSNLDLMIVMGGDGTLLSAARGVGPGDTPLFAVNLGGLGFMMTSGPERLLENLERVLEGDFVMRSRAVLEAHVFRGNESVGTFHALNDVVMHKATMARLLEIDAYAGDQFVCSYRADGLIVSTPTGSTAYTLSAGGPVIFPLVEAFCLTPICPHTLTNRPVLLPDSLVVELVLAGGEGNAYFTVDGQVGVNLRLNDRVIAQRAKHRIKLIQPERQRFFEVLRSKLHWGER